MSMGGFFNRIELLIDSLNLIDPDLLPPSFESDLLGPLRENPADLQLSRAMEGLLQLVTDILGLIECEGSWSDWEFLRRRFEAYLKCEDLIFLRNTASGPFRVFPRSYETGEADPEWPTSLVEEGFGTVQQVDGNRIFLRLAGDAQKDATSFWYVCAKPLQDAEPVLLELLYRSGGWLPPFLSQLEQKNRDTPKKGAMTLGEAESSGILGESPNFLEALAATEKASKTEAPIYLRGESGTGKELFAKRIHRKSNRKDRHFVAINCAAVPHDLIESELFGHEKGAFTGAYYRKIGKAEIADGGTLFLDEVGEMPLAFQAKLLRFLQEKTFTRVGGNSSIKSDARIIVATHRDLEERVKQHQFREDLYYRINVIPIHIPALRKRPGDIRLLARHFFASYLDKMGKKKQVEEEVFDFLDDYPFPGNVRELENLIHRMVAMSSSKVIRLGDLPADLIEKSGKLNRNSPRYQLHPFEGFDQVIPQSRDELQAYREKVEHLAGSYIRELERRFLRHVLEQADGKVRKAAELADINRTLFYKLLKRAGIDVGNLGNHG